MPTPTLYPGDHIEYSLSQEVASRRSSTWIKVGASTTIRDSETATQAYSRLQSFVEARLVEEVEALTNEP